MASLDSKAYEQALKARVARLIKACPKVEADMASDEAKHARSTVARRTGGTAASITSEKGTFRATNPYLEFGTSKMSARPFYRPAQNVVAEAFRSGKYRPEF